MAFENNIAFMSYGVEMGGGIVRPDSTLEPVVGFDGCSDGDRCWGGEDGSVY